jgi:hypothetical protein
LLACRLVSALRSDFERVIVVQIIGRVAWRRGTT